MNEIKEVMENEIDEVIFVAEKITPKSHKGLKVVSGVAAMFAVGFAAYKGIKYRQAKKKAQKEQEDFETDVVTEETVED